MSDIDHKIYLKDILACIDKIKRYVGKKNLINFVTDVKTYDAVLRNLEIIGEAVKKIPADLKQKHKDIEWKKIAGLRDILIHDYSGIDEEIIWDIIKNKLPEFRKQIKRILQNE